MEKKQIELVVTGVLTVFLFVMVLGKLTGKNKGAEEVVREIPQQEQYVPMEREKPVLQGEETKDWGGDPFHKDEMYAAKTDLCAGLKLVGIIWDEENPQAIINDDIVKKGDTVNGCTVLEIKKTKVILNKGVEEIKLDL